MTEFIEGALEVIDESAETLFPPKPGGLVDKYRRRMAEQTAAEAEQEHVAERIEAPSYKAVKVASQSPETLTAITYTIGAGQIAQILPLNPYRYRAIINLITASATAVLCKDQGMAIAGSGYVLQAANPIVSVFSRAQLWAQNNTGSSIQISVLAESYAPEA